MKMEQTEVFRNVGV